MSGIEDLINNVVDQDFSKAGPMFSDILQDKVNDALEQEKINIAANVYNDGNQVEVEEPEESDTIDAAAEEEDVDLEDIEDPTDEEIDAAIDELEDAEET